MPLSHVVTLKNIAMADLGGARGNSLEKKNTWVCILFMSCHGCPAQSFIPLGRRVRQLHTFILILRTRNFPKLCCHFLVDVVQGTVETGQCIHGRHSYFTQMSQIVVYYTVGLLVMYINFKIRFRIKTLTQKYIETKRLTGHINTTYIKMLQARFD